MSVLWIALAGLVAVLLLIAGGIHGGLKVIEGLFAWKNDLDKDPDEGNER